MKSRKKRKPEATVYSDFGTPERRRQRPMTIERVPADMADTTNRDRVRAININDPLRKAFRNDVITRRERDAGLVLRL